MARSGHPEEARREIDELAALVKTLTAAKNPYWDGQVEIQRLRAEAAALPGFSLPAWHDKLLELGTLPLLVLRKELERRTEDEAVGA